MTTKTKNGVFLRDSFILKLLRDEDMKEYLIRIIASILKIHPEILGEDFEIINTKIGVAKDVKNAEGDIVIRCKYGLYDVEANFNPLSRETDNKNISYICSLVLKQIEIGSEKKYKDIKPVILFNLSRSDCFKKGKFIYSSSMLEEELHLKRTNIFKIIDINLVYLKKMSYNEIRDLEINTTEKLLYILTCENRSLWKKIYGDDEFMKKVEEKINELDVLLDAYMDYDREAYLERTKKEGYEQMFREEIKEDLRDEVIKEVHEEFRQKVVKEVHENLLETARVLIKNGVDRNFVLDTFKLSDEEV